MEENLREVEEDIKSWKFDTPYQVLNKKKELLARVNEIQCSLQKRDNIEGLRKLEVKLQKELIHILRKEVLMWYQRSKVRWLANEDHNTRYYHMKIISRWTHNKISMLKNDQG